jgi:branched-subunit amino acid transport protein
MSRAWLVVIGAGAVTFLLKGAGPVILGARPLPPRLQPVLQLLAPALFAALIVTQAFSAGPFLTIDARAAGVVVAIACAWLRAPAFVAVVAAVAVTATVRFLS